MNCQSLEHLTDLVPWGLWITIDLSSIALAAGAFSLFVIVHSLIGPFAGSMVDRFGPRRVILLGLLFLGIGLALCSLTRTWWHYYIFFGVITAVGVGFTGWILIWLLPIMSYEVC